MKDGTNQADEEATQVPRRDRGVTFIEILVAVVLIGTVVVGVLTAVRATVIATRVERDHSKAQQWLQSAVGVVEAAPFEACGTAPDGAAVQATYQFAVDTGTAVPYGFDGTIVVEVPEAWNGTGFVAFDSQTQCYDGDARNRQQRIELVVTNVNGISESVEMIKIDR